MKNLDEIKFDEKKRHQAGMTVPEGFFEQFQQQLEAKIDTLEAVKPAPVVEMPVRKPFGLEAWHIAASVAIVVVVGAGSFFLLNDSTAEDTTPQVAQTECAPTDEESEMEDMVIRSVNDFELYDYYCEL